MVHVGRVAFDLPLRSDEINSDWSDEVTMGIDVHFVTAKRNNLKYLYTQPGDDSPVRSHTDGPSCSS